MASLHVLHFHCSLMKLFVLIQAFLPQVLRVYNMFWDEEDLQTFSFSSIVEAPC